MMPNITIQAEKWHAYIDLSQNPETPGLFNLQCSTIGHDGDGGKEAALEAARWVYQFFAGGREAWIRAAPEASSEQNFDTKVWQHQGYTRFSFCLVPGPHHMMPRLADGPVYVPGLGDAEVK